MEHTGDQNFDLMYAITQALIRYGYFPDLFILCRDPTESPSETQLVLLKLLDGYLSSPKTVTVISPVTAINDIELSQLLYKDAFMEISKPLSVQVMTKKIENSSSERIAAFALVVMECLTCLSTLSQDVKNLLVELGCVTEFLDLLKRADELIPRKTLKTKQDSEQSSSKCYEFPNLKRQIVELLSYLVEGNKQVQDQIRTSGGLPVILSQCNIDDNNPCE